VRHDPNVPMDRLAWNRLPGPYWFHYTTPFASSMIVQERAYIVGRSKPAGLYVTKLQPGELEDDALVRRLFDGEYVIERVQSAVVLHDDPELPFDRVGRSAYHYKRAKGRVIDLDGIVVGRAFKQDGLWYYDRALWDF
jgi:hypothetical protein